MAAAENKAILHRYAEEIFNQGNLAVIDEIIAPNVVSRTSGADIHNRESFRTFVVQFRASFLDIRCTIEDMIAEGDLVAIHWTFCGTQRGEFLGIAPTGKTMTATGTNFYRLRDGQIEQTWGDWDLLGLQQQLGGGAK
jgi:steroid delta-isomerase-like uncharacterized protein